MKVNFKKGGGLAPAIIQDCETRRVLMLGYMNAEALSATQREGRVVFWSRLMERLWRKGESSGNWFEVKEIKCDCDGDALLIKVRPHGPACHTGSDTCFAEENGRGFNCERSGAFLAKLSRLIADRKLNPLEGSYTSRLFSGGVKKIAQKVGEESVELILEADHSSPQEAAERDPFLEEAADLMFHFLVLLEARGRTLDDVVDVLIRRNITR